ncbi:3-deoxy-D-manno-octulosonic acid transferase [Verminephrobacter aporrectodeae subsp. tuberculatae]|uniref:3-deoxy-D-manno-octulosonic acid transferase n=1 Tax=Verminephrobacter aporrectodeae subsp. tuberculatae TaxID=1110392 RepID=A0ABT3KV62_9BURK|nr:3-deoxy-D-manno-octulosonic acid transferase [Verminephrobacter aporrectodeae]MCW5256612.1 3-deoxy-D-manno-octulosonic acid transferase [Verminephrobacter aporrectodeae subsp. tuberculatae]MCW5322224.1 3-deoxy-D-manno-octulosonic acid transferase [Verminephrobacter aporrectodeae subsp. tuberculatae]
MSAARALYSLLTWCAQPLLRRKLRRRAVAEPAYAQAMDERFGRYPAAAIDRLLAPGGSAGRLVWLHAVSLGETRAAAVLLERLREQLPGMRLLLTHGTATGRAEGEKLLRSGDLQVWQPWDTPGAVARFLRSFRPAVGVLLDTEVWPNLVAGCRRHGVPLVLANARLSEKSLRRAQRLAALARPAYGALSAVWAQTGEDAARLRCLGAEVRGVLGNLKFDLLPNAEQLAQGRAWRAQTGRPVLMLASSREGEEALWLEHFQKARAHPAADAGQAADVQWLIVPRHPQRFDAVQQLFERAGLSVSRRSAWAALPEPADLWLGDSLGEMALYYGLADAALLGGSFAPLGGQNLIEAAACGCPVLLGPHTFNFAQAAELACAAGAAQRVAHMAAGMALATQWVHDAAQQGAASARATRFAGAHRGAAQATAQAIAAIVQSAPAPPGKPMR